MMIQVEYNGTILCNTLVLDSMQSTTRLIDQQGAGVGLCHRHQTQSRENTSPMAGDPSQCLPQCLAGSRLAGNQPLVSQDQGRAQVGPHMWHTSPAAKALEPRLSSTATGPKHRKDQPKERASSPFQSLSNPLPKLHLRQIRALSIHPFC